jgi:hypothetical protein
MTSCVMNSFLLWVFYKNTHVESPTPWGVRLHDIIILPITDILDTNVYLLNTDKYDVMRELIN